MGRRTRRTRRTLLVILTAVTGVLAAGCSSPSTAEPSPSAVSASATPSPSDASGTKDEVLTKSLEIKAGQSPEDIAKKYIALSNEWLNAGCNESTLQESDKQTSITLQEFSTKKATELATPYIIALFGPDYEKSANAMNYRENGIKLNASIIELYIRSDPAYNKDVKAHFKQTEIFDAFVSSTQNGDVTSLIFDLHLENNSRDAPGVVTDTPSGQKLRYTLQFKEMDGVERLVTAQTSDL